MTPSWHLVLLLGALLSQSKAESFNTTEVPNTPVFTRQHTMVRVVAKPAGNMLRLKCPAAGNPPPNITWFKNDATPERYLGTIRYGRWSLLMEDLVTTDSGNYTCMVCNSYGCINFTFNVIILERFLQKPYIKDDYPHNVTAVLNSTAVLECPTISDLEPYVRWRRVSGPMGELTRAEDIAKATQIQEVRNDCMMDNGSSDHGCKSPEVLEIHNVTYEDSGWYTCIAGNALGISYASAYLKVVENCVSDHSQSNVSRIVTIN